jgi:SAM-dependent methyltransferase
MELGPGDPLGRRQHALGARESWLSDAGDFANRDPNVLDSTRPWRRGRQTLLRAQLRRDFRLIAHYLAGGASLAEPSGSVDFAWSEVVLEHVRRHEFARLAAELARILNPDGVMSHSIDLRDHLGGSLNNLRFSPQRWEHPSWREAGFYTNRMSQAEIIDVFAAAGFKAVDVRDDLWPGPPLPRTKMHPSFRGRTDEELSVAGFDVVLVRL